MPMISSTDPDFRVCQIDFGTLIEIQSEAEAQGWATRWTSVAALRSQVKDDVAFLQSMMREERGGVVRTYRCLLLFSAASEGGAGGITTIDLSPSRLQSLKRLDRDPDVRKALARIFSLALGGVSTTSKQ